MDIANHLIDLGTFSLNKNRRLLAVREAAALPASGRWQLCRAKCRAQIQSFAINQGVAPGQQRSEGTRDGFQIGPQISTGMFQHEQVAGFEYQEPVPGGSC